MAMIKIIDDERIIEHLEKACKKHPQFCKKFLTEEGSRKVTLAMVRKMREINPCAQTILGEEVVEIYDAYSEGDKLHAIDECYDAIAVLLHGEVH